MRERIRRIMSDKDTLGGVVEVVALNAPVGLGSHVHWDRRLSARLAAAVMSIHAVKGVEIGDGFAEAQLPGTRVQDELYIEGANDGELRRRSNHAGGIEGGITNGEPIVLRGTVVDCQGRPVPGALVEVWQANRHGKYEHPADRYDAPLDPHFKGFGRALTGADGGWRFVSIKPQGYPNPGYDQWLRPPHVHFSVYAAGVMHRLITQMYFPGEPLNDIDPILNSIEDLDARASLIAREAGTEDTAGGAARVFEFPIVLRGECETPFQLEG